MAGVSDNPNRRARRAAAATGTAPAAPAIEASAERAAIERDPAAPAVIPAPTAPVLPAAELPDDAAVLPEPTLTAEPGAPAPIVTASPILAVEPSATDVVQAQAADARIEAGTATEADRDQARIAAAGQPTIAIEGDTTALKAALIDHEADAGVRITGDDIMRDRDPYGLHREMVDGRLVLTLDEIGHGLELLAQRDPTGLDIIRTRFFAEPARPVLGMTETTDTITMVEVLGPAQGRRRAGMTFGPEPRRFPVDVLSVAEIDALRADPLLTVGFTQVDAAVANQWDR